MLADISALTIAIVAALSAAPPPPDGRFDRFSDTLSPPNFRFVNESGLGLTVKGEFELELHDIEGRGGPGYDSVTDTRTLGTRSPFVEIDAFWLALRFDFGQWLAFNTAMIFTPLGARIGASWLDYQQSLTPRLRHHGELGLNLPMIAIDRRSERYPLIATAFWRHPEFHATYELSVNITEHILIDAGLSVAMMRPLSTQGVQESESVRGTINILAYGPARPFSGNSAIIGGRLRLRAHGFFMESFAFAGQLAVEAGTDVLRSAFAAYQDLPGFYPQDEQSQARHALWYGARVGFISDTIFIFAEAIRSHEGLLHRHGAYAQASYWLFVRDAPLFGGVEPLVRYEIYRIENSSKPLSSGRALRSPAVGQAITWDWNILTVALNIDIWRYLLRLRLEYYFIHENNGIAGLGIDPTPFPNNEFLAQLEFRF